MPQRSPRRTRACLAGLALLAAAVAPAAASDFRSLSEPAILYDSPSKQGKPMFVLLRGTPVETVVTVDRWVKVRDAGGSLLWLERRQLADKRTVIVTAAKADVRQRPDAAAPLAFEAARDVVLELAGDKPAEGWVKVRHRDGTGGFVRLAQIWGV